MKKNLLLLPVILLSMTGFMFSDAVTFKVGYFLPRAQSDLWEVEFDNMDFDRPDYQASSFGFEYEYFVSRELSLVIGVDTYTKQKAGLYNLYVSDTIDGQDYAFDYGEGFGISHVFSVSNTPLQVSFKLTPMGRGAKFIPYLGGGVCVCIWSVRLQGDVIDLTAGEEFYDSALDAIVIGYPIFSSNTREENKFSLGFQAFGGFMMPVANRISMTAEFKYYFIKGNFSNDPLFGFAGFDPFDLNSIQISIGLNYWF